MKHAASIPQGPAHPAHRSMSSEIQSSFGDLELAELAFVGERLDVFILLTDTLNRNTRFQSPLARERAAIRPPHLSRNTRFT
jgi:hypothetical protein